MHLYRTFDGESPTDRGDYHGTLALAQSAAKARFPTHARRLARIDLHDIPTDKGGIIALLNAGGLPSEAVPARSWGLSSRGGLVEITAGE